MKAVYIYALKDPITGLIRYIGVTTRPKTRLKEHLQPSNVKKSNHRSCWIRSLVSKGQHPVIEFLAQAGANTWEQDEIDYISVFKSLGCDLINHTDGGGGLLNPPPAVREKISAAKIGKAPWNKGKTCPQLSAAMSGEKNPNFGRVPWNKGKPCPAVAVRIGNKNPAFGKIPWNKGVTGTKRSPEAIAKTAAKNTGKKRTLETRAKQSAAALGKKHSKEHVANGAASRRRNEEKKKLWQTNLLSLLLARSQP